eukprot:UN24864
MLARNPFNIYFYRIGLIILASITIGFYIHSIDFLKK